MKSGFVGIIGIPNAGKSSLVNKLVGEQVSVVTSKPQTTRTRTLGITNTEDAQIVWIDTPGIIESAKGLNPLLKTEMMEALKDADVIIAAVTPEECLQEKHNPWALDYVKNIKSLVVVATQMDRVKDQELRSRIYTRLKDWFHREPIATSSLKSLGLKEVIEKVSQLLPEGPAYYDRDLYTPQSLREIAAEEVRKSAFEHLHQEVPYGLTVIVRDFKEKHLFDISADLVVNKNSHKSIVIGKGGQTLKAIGTAARATLEKNLGQKVFLRLHVVVRENWQTDRKMLLESGFKNA